MDKNLKYIIFVLAFLQAAIVSVAFAQEDNSALTNDTASTPYEENLKKWQNMSEEQREAIRQKVQVMDSQQMETILENAKQFKQLSKEEQNRIQGNFQKFKELPSEKKEFLRERNMRFQRFSPEARTQLRRGEREKRKYKEEDIHDRPEDVRNRREDRRDQREDVGNHGPGFDRKPGRDNNTLPGQRDGSGKNWQNHSGYQESAGASLDRRPAMRQGLGTGQGRQRRNAGSVMGRDFGGGSAQRGGRGRRK